jgi:hypothetical protein
VIAPRYTNGASAPSDTGSMEPRRAPVGEAPAGIGHNSKVAKAACDTPSKLSFDQAAALNSGQGRISHRIRVLQSAIFDPRLGECPLPIKLLVAVMEHANWESGASYPGSKTLAEAIYQDLQALPPDERAEALEKAAAVIMNALTLLKKCGYDVTTRRAPPNGGRAVTHHALTYPTRDETQAALAVHREQLAEKAAKERAKYAAGKEPDITQTVRSGADLTQRMRSDDITQPVRSGEADLTQNGVLTSRRTHPPLYIEPGINPPTTKGADAPRSGGGEKGFSGRAPHQPGSPSDGATPAARVDPCKPSSGTDDEPPAIEMSPACWQALTTYNEAAAQHGFTPCRTPTADQAKRLGRRIKAVGGLATFKRALGALPLDDFLMGRVPGKGGGKPFKLSLDRLLQTDGGMGDVLGRLLGLADEAGVGTNGAADPDARLKAFAATPEGKAVIKRYGLDEGTRRLREILNKGAD